MDLQNTKTNDEGKELLNHGKTLRLHTGNLVNRSRLKKKCPGSPSEEVREESGLIPPKNSRDSFPGFPDTLDCSIPEATDAITPEERDEVKISAKLFLCESGQSAIRDAVEMACQTLAVSQLDSVIIAPPGTVEGDSQSLAHLQLAWEELETLVRKQKIAAIGTSDLDKELLEQLYNWAQVKPSSNQVNLASCCVMPPDLTAFAKEFDIQLLTHSDPKELMSTATFQEAMQEGASGLTATEWRLEWVLRYSVIVKSRGIIKSKGYLVSARRASP
uniref:Glutamate--cysteine ligase regulatory subunit n=1 Tax=Xiphophorus couchianus TaxID=32473 RepID=A0A3B5LXX2_9TELE